ncbi:MAG: hypothetical protein V8R40_13305 [Dysosmobacter sp.]
MLAVILVVIILAAVLFMVFQQFVVYDATRYAPSAPAGAGGDQDARLLRR